MGVALVVGVVEFTLFRHFVRLRTGVQATVGAWRLRSYHRFGDEKDSTNDDQAVNEEFHLAEKVASQVDAMLQDILMLVVGRL